MSSKMFRYMGKRLILAIITIFIIIALTFVVMHAVPSSPFNKEKALPPAVKAALEAKYGLDKPLGRQFINYLANIMRFDFGDSIYYQGNTVLSLLQTGLKTSARLGLTAAGIALFVGILLGSLAALGRDTMGDKVIQVMTTALVAVPSFVMALMMLWVFGVWWPILPTRGDIPMGSIMPTIALALYPTAYVTRLTRSSMLDVLGQDYIRTAYAKGLDRYIVIFKHALRNALTPVITYAGPMIAYIVCGSFVVEQIFSMAGLGKYFVNSIQNSDYTMIMGTTVLLSIVMISLNFICDILYTIVDKRVDLS
ncbi:MAG: ABC transporter permease [Clostridiales bacterium]|nr:ABC transporter permease [Clostridiales bacterium]